MRKHAIGLIAAVLMLACIQNAFALRIQQMLTPERQGQLGLRLTLTATPVPATANQEAGVNIDIEIPQKGEFEDLSMMQMELKEGESTLLMSQMTTTHRDGSTFASFMVVRSLVDKCFINLFVQKKDDRLYPIYYTINLKSYLDVIPN